MLTWRAVYHHSGTVVETCPAREPLSFASASDLVDLRWAFAGQDATVTLECVDEAGAVVARWAPHPEARPIPPERLAALIAEFRE